MFEWWPALWLFAGAALAPLFGRRLRAAIMLGVPLLGAYGLYQLAPGSTVTVELFSFELTPVRVDDLSLLFGYLFHLAASASSASPVR
jgi:multicomponent Na+:H+ antiporter subunit D